MRYRFACLAASVILPVSALASSIENKLLRLSFDTEHPAESMILLNKITDGSFPLSTAAPTFEFEGKTAGGPSVAAIRLTHQQAGSTGSVTIEYPTQMSGQVTLKLRTVFTVSPDEPLVRKHAELDVARDVPASTPASAAAGESSNKLTLKRVMLLDEPLPEPATFTMDGWQSYPVFTGQYFFGVEFPVARAEAANGRIRLSHAPGLVFAVPHQFRSRDAVIGVCPKGRVREAFEQYVASFRPMVDRVHFNYNSWWTSPLPFGESDIIKLIRAFDEKLYRKHHVSFDTFTLDLGWSEPQGIWKISSKMFPQGFTPLTSELGRQQSGLGLWWSPSNCYSPASFDSKWAASEGYETFPSPGSPLEAKYACLVRGGRYQRDATKALCGMIQNSAVGQLKFDGYLPDCPSSAHGHLPGELSREPIAEGIIDLFDSLRRTNPDVWCETTCFGYDASPWWLRWVNSVIGPYGDDSPNGAVPAPVYRESYTTSRDFFNLHGSVTPVPIAAQEVLGIIHQSRDPMYNDAVTTVLRGHQFISLYLNPTYMADRDYAFVARLMEWTRANASLLARTKIIWPRQWRKQGPTGYDNPKAMPRQTYGYAHWRDGQGLVCLRNPWIAMDEIEVVLDEATIGLDENGGQLAVSSKTYAAVQIYPYPTLVARGLRPGDTLKVKMGPYQTRVLRLVSNMAGDGPIPPDKSLEAGQTKATMLESSVLEQTATTAQTQPFGDDYTVRSRPKTSLWWSQLQGETAGEGWKLYYLVESPPPSLAVEELEVLVNGSPAKVQVIDSEAGWSAAQPQWKQNTWRWYIVPLPAGAWLAKARIEVPSADATVSAWLIRSTAPPAHDELATLVGKPAMPLPPDNMVCVSLPAIPVQPIRSLTVQKVTVKAKVDRINGVHLDRLEPVSAQQGWGTLHRNLSVMGDALSIGGRRFVRGVGTHAVAQIVYNLNGRYKMFHGLAGHHDTTGGSLTMAIEADGKRVWESGPLQKGDSAKAFDVSLAGARQMTLIVGDAGDTYMGDHADWVDTWLEFADGVTTHAAAMTRKRIEFR